MSPSFRDRIRGLARLPAERLTPARRNFRTHDHKQRGVLRGLLAELGVVGSVLAWVPDDEARSALRAAASFDVWLSKYDGKLELIDGHMRAEELRSHTIPVLITDLDAEEAAKALATFDAVSDMAGQDADLLTELLKEIGTAKEPGTEELLEILRGDEETPDTTGLDDAPTVDEIEPRTKRGDLWVLGSHRLLCGDSTSPDDVTRALDGATASLLWTDPPYNVAYVGKTKAALTIKNDAMDNESFRTFLRDAFAAADRSMSPGAGFYIAHADTEGFNFRGAVRDVGWKFAQCLVWVKDVFVMGRQDYHWRHEPILYGWKLGAGHHALKDRTQDTVWEIPRPKRNEEHPTMKPVELVTRAIQNSSARGAIVLDIFGGSGTTLIACESTGRAARVVELDPRYCDVIVARWEKMTGQKAYLSDAKEAA
jgi:DNA modification methylase